MISALFSSLCQIALYADGNMRRGIFMLEACKVAQYPFSDDQSIHLPEWETYIINLGASIRKEQSPAKLLEARQKVSVMMKTLKRTHLKWSKEGF